MAQGVLIIGVCGKYKDSVDKNVKLYLTSAKKGDIIAKLSLRSEAEGRRGRRKSGGSV